MLKKGAIVRVNLGLGTDEGGREMTNGEEGVIVRVVADRERPYVLDFFNENLETFFALVNATPLFNEEELIVLKEENFDCPCDDCEDDDDDCEFCAYDMCSSCPLEEDCDAFYGLNQEDECQGCENCTCDETSPLPLDFNPTMMPEPLEFVDEEVLEDVIKQLDDIFSGLAVSEQNSCDETPTPYEQTSLESIDSKDFMDIEKGDIVRVNDPMENDPQGELRVVEVEERPYGTVYTLAGYEDYRFDYEELNLVRKRIVETQVDIIPHDDTVMEVKTIVNEPAVVVILSIHGKQFKGVAKCCPEDEFDMEKGFKIAHRRAVMKLFAYELDTLVK